MTTQFNTLLSELNQSEWEKLETLAEQAVQTLQSLSIELLLASSKVNPELAKRLLAQSEKAKDAHESLFGGYWYHPQGEWLGGESWKTVEPHISGLRRTVPQA